MKKNIKIKKLRLDSATIRNLVLVRGGQMNCTGYTYSDVKSECATMCVDCP